MTRLQWRVHTPNLLREIVANNGTGILQRPLVIFGSILEEVAARASEINDPKLNALMCRLTLYAISDPLSDDYNRELTEQIIHAAATVDGVPVKEVTVLR